jgi:hypothetical protein
LVEGLLVLQVVDGFGHDGGGGKGAGGDGSSEERCSRMRDCGLTESSEERLKAD